MELAQARTAAGSWSRWGSKPLTGPGTSREYASAVFLLDGQRLAEFVGMGGGEVDLVGGSVKCEPHGLLGLGAIDVVDERDRRLLGHKASPSRQHWYLRTSSRPQDWAGRRRAAPGYQERALK